MKSKILILIVLGSFCVFNFGLSRSEKWEYPVKPGSNEWNKLSNIEEILAVQQIPERILNKMSTEEVCQAWLELPGKLDILLCNTDQQGFDCLKERYNVVREMLSRKDIHKVILKNYYKINILDIRNKKTLKEQTKFGTDIAFNEIVLYQPEILNKMSQNELKKLFMVVKKGLGSKHGVFDGKTDSYWINSAMILEIKILDKIGEDKKLNYKGKYDRSFKYGKIYNKDDYNSIMELINQSNYQF